jgi:hypothetical protein
LVVFAKPEKTVILGLIITIARMMKESMTADFA